MQVDALEQRLLLRRMEDDEGHDCGEQRMSAAREHPHQGESPDRKKHDGRGSGGADVEAGESDDRGVEELGKRQPVFVERRHEPPPTQVVESLKVQPLVRGGSGAAITHHVGQGGSKTRGETDDWQAPRQQRLKS